MNYFLDQEFHERMYKPLFGKEHHIIELISIGIVAEDGREYYAISKEFDVDLAFKNKWLKNNVLLPILYDLFKIGDIYGDQRNRWCFSPKDFKRLLKRYGRSKKEISEEVERFVRIKNHTNCNTNVLVDDKTHLPVAFYGYYADYDWVLFCSLFGSMMQLPKGFPMYCYDLKQMLDEKVDKSTLTEYGKDLKGGGAHENFEGKLKLVKARIDYPKQENEHNAVADARWNKKLYEFLKAL